MTARQTLPFLAVLFATAPLPAQVPAPGPAPMQIVTTTLPAAQTGAPYNQQLLTTGGTCQSTIPNSSTASASIDSGALPPGIYIASPISTKQWFLQGTPTATGNFSFIVHLYWRHTRENPFDSDCSDDAAQALTLTVQAGVPVITVNRSQLAVTYHTGHFPPPADFVQVTSPTPTVFSASTTTDTGGSWLSVSPPSTNSPATITVSYSINGLAAGTYTGRVTVTSGTAALLIPVTLTVVTDASISLLPTPTSLSFTAAPGGADPPAQSIAVAVAGDAVIFQAATVVLTSTKWLTISPTASATPAQIAVAASVKGLAAGTYNASILLSVNGVPNSVTTIPVTFTVTAPAPTPTIAPGGILNAASASAAIAPGTWVSVFGAALSTTTRSWRTLDFVNGALPLSLDGVSVTINGKAAAVAFVSPAQINVLATDDSATGLVPVVVKTPTGASPAVFTLLQTLAPGFFQFPGNYAAATHADGTYVAGPALAKLGVLGTPAKPGETIVLYGTGFGPTQPAFSATAPVAAPLPLAPPTGLAIRIAGVDASIAYAGLISPGVYQFNVVVPQIPDGEAPVIAEMRGLLTQTALYLTIQH